MGLSQDGPGGGSCAMGAQEAEGQEGGSWCGFPVGQGADGFVPHSLRTSETSYLNEAFSFYSAIRQRSYYSQVNKEDRYV